MSKSYRGSRPFACELTAIHNMIYYNAYIRASDGLTVAVCLPNVFALRKQPLINIKEYSEPLSLGCRIECLTWTKTRLKHYISNMQIVSVRRTTKSAIRSLFPFIFCLMKNGLWEVLESYEVGFFVHTSHHYIYLHWSLCFKYRHQRLWHNITWLTGKLPLRTFENPLIILFKKLERAVHISQWHRVMYKTLEKLSFRWRWIFASRKRRL